MLEIPANLEAPTLVKQPEDRSIEVNWTGCTESGCENVLEYGEVGKGRKKLNLPNNSLT